VNDVDELIQQARPGGPQATGAIRQLLHLGLSVLDRSITAFEMEPMASPGLGEVISRSNSPEAVPALLDKMDSASIALSKCSMNALATSQDPRALERLLEFVTDESRLETRRSLAASALGAASGVDVPAALKWVVDQQAGSKADPDDDPQFLLIEAIVALAKHGDHSRAPLLLELASNQFSAAQELAIKGLELAVADGMIEALAAASRSPATSVAILAAKPLFLLGTAQSAEVLHSMTTSDEFDVHRNARIYAARILGIEFTERDETAQLEIEWNNARESMTEQTCYRSGRPIQLSRLAESLEQGDNARLQVEVADEFRIRTGLDAQGALLLGNTQELLRSVNRMHLEDGALYRWGHRQSFPTR